MSMERDFAELVKDGNRVVHTKFMVESNKIEGENRLNPGDLEAIEYSLKDVNSIQDILELHKLLGSYLNKSWVGRFRLCDVIVGNYRPPSVREVERLMKEYIGKLPYMNSWEAHNEFERIHPFRDLNGRVGRLIWLSKAIDEGYNFKLSFLHMYYYQTLVKENGE